MSGFVLEDSETKDFSSIKGVRIPAALNTRNSQKPNPKKPRIISIVWSLVCFLLHGLPDSFSLFEYDRGLM